MKRATYRKLQLIRLVGGAVILATVVATWLSVISAGLVLLAFVLICFPAAMASLAVRNMHKEELS